MPDLAMSAEAQGTGGADTTPADAGGERSNDAVSDLGSAQCPPSQCRPGTCSAITVASGLADPRGFAVGEDAVYVANTSADTVVKIDKSGGTPVVIAPKRFPSDMPWGVAVTTTHVYWTSYFRSYVARVGLDGQDLTMLVPSGETYAQEIAVDDTHVYWTGPSLIRKATKDGGPAVTLGQGESPAQIAVHGPFIYWTTQSIQPGSGRVMSMGLNGENRTPLVTGLARAGAIAVHGSDVYYNEAGDIFRVPAAGGPWTAVILGQSAGAMTVDRAGVYWANTGEDTVMTVGLGGGTPRTLASDQKEVARMAVDACNVYWLSSSAGTVMRVPK